MDNNPNTTALRRVACAHPACTATGSIPRSASAGDPASMVGVDSASLEMALGGYCLAHAAQPI